MIDAGFPAQWFDGRSAIAQACTLHVDAQVHGGGGLLLRTALGVEHRYAAAAVQWPERTRHGRRQILLDDGSVVDLPDAAGWDAWSEAQGLRQPLAARWALSWRWAIGSSLAMLVFLFASWRWFVPWGAEAAAHWVPWSWEQRIGESSLRQVDQLWMKPSELPQATRAQIEQAVQSMVAKAYPGDQAPRYRLLFRQANKALGPNALALPGGDIIVTDALVEMLPTQNGQVSPTLLAVVAHELGHVRGRHGLEMLFKAGAITAVTGIWLGDFSSLLATVPAWLAQAGYSREAEREADDEALRVMRAAGIDPRVMVLFFQKLKQAFPERDGDGGDFGLASHPPDSERMRLFETGQR